MKSWMCNLKNLIFLQILDNILPHKSAQLCWKDNIYPARDKINWSNENHSDWRSCHCDWHTCHDDWHSLKYVEEIRRNLKPVDDWNSIFNCAAEMIYSINPDTSVYLQLQPDELINAATLMDHFLPHHRQLHIVIISSVLRLNALLCWSLYPC